MPIVLRYPADRGCRIRTQQLVLVVGIRMVRIADGYSREPFRSFNFPYLFRADQVTTVFRRVKQIDVSPPGGPAGRCPSPSRNRRRFTVDVREATFSGYRLDDCPRRHLGRVAPPSLGFVLQPMSHMNIAHMLFFFFGGLTSGLVHLARPVSSGGSSTNRLTATQRKSPVPLQVMS